MSHEYLIWGKLKAQVLGLNPGRPFENLKIKLSFEKNVCFSVILKYVPFWFKCGHSKIIHAKKWQTG